MSSRDLDNHVSENSKTIADIIKSDDWEGRFRNLKAQYDILEQENQQLKNELSQCREQNDNTLPSKDELDSISSMLDIINKLDENTLNKIERLNNNR